MRKKRTTKKKNLSFCGMLKDKALSLKDWVLDNWYEENVLFVEKDDIFVTYKGVLKLYLLVE